ncbi:MAG: hypothetical protein M3O34_18475 [Chloroflexota bacterium]|nr:hypothetical protein [Chloroflexota bacterium]
MRRLLQRLVVMCVVVAIPQSSTWAAQLQSTCPPGQAPSFAFGFATLAEQVGPAMGDPVECERADVETGDALQRTTTGLALYRKDTNTAMFTNGREHWALTTGGVAHWSGWHGSAAPPGVAAARQFNEVQHLAAPAGPYPSVEAVTVLESLDDTGRRLVILRDGGAYQIATTDECNGGRPADGQVMFIVSPGDFAGPDSRLIPQLGDHECPITESRPL